MMKHKNNKYVKEKESENLEDKNILEEKDLDSNKENNYDNDEKDLDKEECQCDDCCHDDCECEDHCDCDDADCHCGCHEITEEAAQYLELAQRVQVEFDNYRKRNQDAIKEAEARGTMKAVEKLLPIVDSITSAKRQVQDESLKSAIDVLYNQVLQLFSKLNVTKIEAKGLEFDPHKHNAVLTEEVEGVKPDIVLEELQEGFEMGDKVIRHSVVKVSK